MTAVVYDSIWNISKNNTFMTQTEKDSNGKISSANGEYAYLGAWNQDVCYYKVLGGMNGDEWDSRCYVFYLELDSNESFTLFDGLKIPEYFDSANLDGFKGLKIGVYADAIQTEGFVDGENAENDVTATAWYQAFTALEKQHPLGWWRDWSSANG